MPFLAAIWESGKRLPSSASHCPAKKKSLIARRLGGPGAPMPPCTSGKLCTTPTSLLQMRVGEASRLTLLPKRIMPISSSTIDKAKLTSTLDQEAHIQTASLSDSPTETDN